MNDIWYRHGDIGPPESGGIEKEFRDGESLFIEGDFTAIREGVRRLGGPTLGVVRA
jgi:hypothetical protein